MILIRNGKYKVAANGEIHKWKTHKQQWVKCKQSNSSQGKYKTVYMDGRSEYVHIITFKAYHGVSVIPKGMQIDHVDNNHHNNHHANLRMITRSENARKAIRRSHAAGKLKQHLLRKKVRVTFIETSKVKTFKSITIASNELEIPQQSIIDNLKGRSKVCYKKYRFKYV